MTAKEQAVGFVSLPELHSVSHYGPTSSIRTKEFLRYGGWRQYGASEMIHVFDQEDLSPLLDWLANHPYALFVDDVRNSNNGVVRKRVDIQEVLKTGERSWVGPDRYDPQKPLLDQKELALEEGINCQVAVHAAAEFFGKWIADRGDKSAELFCKEQHYRKIDVNQVQLEVGDILFFHEQPQIRTAKALHLVMVVGKDLSGMPWILHVTSQFYKKRPAAEAIPLSSLFLNRQKYFYGAVRLQEKPATVAAHELTPIPVLAAAEHQHHA